MDLATQRKLLALVGLGARGRLVVVGVEQVRRAVLKGKVLFAVVAPDASKHSREKVVPLLAARRVGFVEGPGAAELGRAVGREATAAVGIVDEGLARGIRALLHRGAAAPVESSPVGTQ